MREYIPRHIGHGSWQRIISVIRDYKSLKKDSCSADITDIKKKELERKISAFEKLWENTDAEIQALIKDRYWSGKTYRDILLPMSESTMKREVRRFIIALGKNLGEI